ncbi:MAG TPA: hypothetical protein VM261_31845 [Kofleriaceae bacterium]|nr:hypothetical protein [Kofleriaceae bacterium]
MKNDRTRDGTCLAKPGHIADPWAGVDGDQPELIPTRLIHRSLEESTAECTAANDHCLRECAWIIGKDSDEVDNAIASYRYNEEGNFEGDAGAPYRAYRTVPATKRMLVRGAILAIPDSLSRVGSRSQTLGRGGSYWIIGALDRVDWKTGKVYLVGYPNPAWLSSTRVAVLRYKRGGKVEILGGRKREELAVRADEVFAPLPETSTASDPWSQVKHGQPIVVADTQPFATEEGEGVCKAQNDHCLRPWAWMVDNNSGYAFVGKFDGKTFLGLEAIDQLTPIDGIVAAYRTVPATPKNLKVGTQVFWGGGSERNAHTLRWDTGKVLKIRGDGKVDVERTSRNETLLIEELRVPVVVWYPGEKAEAFP